MELQRRFVPSKPWIPVAVGLVLIPVLAAAMSDTSGEASKFEPSRDPGQFALGADGTVDGVFVDARLDASRGWLYDFRVHDQTYINQLRAPSAFQAYVMPHGNTVVLEGEDWTLEVTDSPMGSLWVNGSTTPFILGYQGPVDRVGNVLQWRAVESTGRSMATMSGVESFGSQLRVTQGSFIVVTDDVPEELRDAVLAGRIGAWANVMAGGMEVSRFLDVDLERVTPESYVNRFIVDAHADHGKAFIIDFWKGAYADKSMGVRYFDEYLGVLSEVGIEPADSLADALSAEAREGPEYWVDRGEAADRVIISVPSFSVHAFDVHGFLGGMKPSIVYGLIFGGLFVALASVGLFVRRRGREYD